MAVRQLPPKDDPFVEDFLDKEQHNVRPCAPKNPHEGAWLRSQG